MQQSYHGYQRWNDILNIIRELAGENGGISLFNCRYQERVDKSRRYLGNIYLFSGMRKGYFDDVACGYRFRCEEEKVNNKLDQVLTESFQSLIVECKVRSKLDQNFYFKLNSLVDMFGIGAHKVLMTTSNTEDNADNQMQKERGNMMGITTISEIEEIQDISEKLKALL